MAIGRRISALILALFLSLALLPATAVAGPFEDGQAAYGRKDYAAALKLWLPLAEHGDATAQNAVGVLYSQGEGVKQDYIQAAKWFRKAAAKGNADAQDSLGWQYTTGHGVTQDTEKGRQLVLQAAAQGNFDAMSHLTESYGIDDNEVENYFWSSIIAKSNKKWDDTRDAAAGRITPAEKAAVDKRIAEWKPHPTVAAVATPAVPDSPLIAAAKSGAVAALAKILAAGVAVDTPDAENLTALNWAAYNGHLPAVKFLIEHGAKIDPQMNKSGWTPLMNASAQGFPKVAALLLEHGADVNARSHDGGYTPLMYAARKGKKAVLLLLLQNNARVNDLSDDKRTALDFAATQSDKSIGETLVAHGGTHGG
jgi:TPR repeat protein